MYVCTLFQLDNRQDASANRNEMCSYNGKLLERQLAEANEALTTAVDTAGRSRVASVDAR